MPVQAPRVPPEGPALSRKVAALAKKASSARTATVNGAEKSASVAASGANGAASSAVHGGRGAGAGGKSGVARG